MTDGQLYMHLMVKAFMGETAEHLRRVHATEPTDSKGENAGRHMEAHGLPRNARWSRRRSQFVSPTATTGGKA